MYGHIRVYVVGVSSLVVTSMESVVICVTCVLYLKCCEVGSCSSTQLC